MARRRRDPGIIEGRSGAVFRNESDRPAFQLIADLINTCPFCIRYHTKVSMVPWPVPLHPRCRCRNAVIPPGGKAERRFVDYAKLYTRLKSDQRAAVVGRSNAALIRAGLIAVEDVVSPERVRTLAEVVKTKRLSIKAMVKAGVAPGIARRAYAEARDLTAAALAEQARRQLFAAIGPARRSIEDLGRELRGLRRPEVVADVGQSEPVIVADREYVVKLRRRLAEIGHAG